MDILSAGAAHSAENILFHVRLLSNVNILGYGFSPPHTSGKEHLPAKRRCSKSDSVPYSCPFSV